ncbi:MAG: hypothetical protein ACREQN_15730 [Candidatus Binataceae bacterium]
MDDEIGTAARSSHTGQWLEVVDGGAPILLIAPHGGHAGPAARATLNPKVNDLETAAITRELATRLGAGALINTGMDRNQLDCNRLSQLAAHAPWMLAMIANRVGEIIARHGRATVLLIHGWNIIEPRVDLGLGLRDRDGKLTPPTGAHVTASDAFINGPVAELAGLLRQGGVIPSYGLRYPGGGVQNLLQAFTARHSESPLAALRDIAAMAARGAIDALQLELSVTLRLPGALRARSVDLLTEVFSHGGRGAAQARARMAAPIVKVIRGAVPRAPVRRAAIGDSAPPPIRVGVEFYDPAARVGGMMSFDFGPGASGGRIMMMFDRNRVALFTAEGKARRVGGRIALGPLTLAASRYGGGLEFRGPAVIVNDGSAYLSVEHALAAGTLDDSMAITAALELSAAPSGFDDFIANLEDAVNDVYRVAPGPDGLPHGAARAAAFGRLRGTVTIDGTRRKLDATARIGFSFSGLGPRKFQTRRMLWACFHDGADAQPIALEARATSPDGLEHHRFGRMLRDGEWSACEVSQIDLDTRAPQLPPERIEALVTAAADAPAMLSGRCENFMTLSRPGPDLTRVHTSLGFAVYRFGGLIGTGMFEYSRPAIPIAQAAARAGSSADDDNED